MQKKKINTSLLIKNKQFFIPKKHFFFIFINKNYTSHSNNIYFFFKLFNIYMFDWRIKNKKNIIIILFICYVYTK